MPDNQKISGSVDSVIYTNEDNGYCVLRLRLNEGGAVTVVGILPFAVPGEEITAEGQWASHPVHGRQFKAEKCERLMPATVSGIYQYLASGVVKGIGPATARTIVSCFGEDTLRVMEETPERLSELKGINEKRAREIGEAFRKQTVMRRLLEFFAANTIPLSYALHLYRNYGEDAMQVLNSNPYLLCDDQYGATFVEADRLAIRMGFEGNSPERVEAAVLYELHHNASNGHCFLPREKLIGASAELISIDESEIGEAVERLLEAGELVEDEVASRSAIYTARLYSAENEIARRFARMSAEDCVPPDDAAGIIRDAQSQMRLQLADRQREAAEAAICHQLFVLTGGPGTGKTTTIQAILRAFDNMGIETVLAAPTGRAAKRMQELSGRYASTIHRLLEAGFDEEAGIQFFGRNEEEPLSAEAVILDEASMVDVLLMQALLRAMKPECRLILVGDSDQLPSVGPGNILMDVLRSGTVPSVRLTEVFRQAQESRIIRNAHRINRGEPPELRENTGDFFFLRRKKPEAAAETVLSLCAERLPQRMGIPPEEIQVLSPSRRGASGTYALNRALQEKLNPPAEGKPEKSFGEFLFRQGDRVMQVRNNYELEWRRENGEQGTGIYNGDIGRITAIDLPGQTLTICFDDRSVLYSFELLSELEPAYAMTVHKAQGSEYRAVILVLGECPKSLLTRSVLYTAVTRAKELLIIVGDDEAVLFMAGNNRTVKRYCGLKRRLGS